MVCGLKSTTGQSLIEYVVVLAIIAAALLGMEIYMKRGVAGRLRSAADSIGDAYAPRHTTASFFTAQQSDVTTDSQLQRGNATQSDVVNTTTTIQNDTNSRFGSETVGELGTDVWN